MENTHSKSKSLILLLFILLMPVALQGYAAWGGSPANKMMIISELSDKDKGSKSLIKETAHSKEDINDLFVACVFIIGGPFFLGWLYCTWLSYLMKN